MSEDHLEVVSALKDVPLLRREIDRLRQQNELTHSAYVDPFFLANKVRAHVHHLIHEPVLPGAAAGGYLGDRCGELDGDPLRQPNVSGASRAREDEGND